MSQQVKSQNRLAVGLIVAAKVFGVLGIILAWAGVRTLGAIFLLIDGLLLLAAVIVTVMAKKEQVVTASVEEQKAILEAMVKDGTIDRYLREIRERDAKADEADADVKKDAAE